MPIGWDTPHYIEQSRIVATQGPFALIAVQGPYDFVYQLFSGFVVWLGVSPVSLEVYLPILLSALFPLILSRLASFNSNLRLATIIALATPGWYAVYALGAELHSNLLGLLLILAALPMLFGNRGIREYRTILGLSLVALASFTHIETTLFLVTVLVVSALVASAFTVRITVSTILVVLPATVIYVLHIFQLFGLVGGALPLFSLEQIWTWLATFGPLLPLAGLGIAIAAKTRKNSLEAFTLIWAFASILVGVSQYLDPQSYIFAQRAALLAPVPILAAIGYVALREWNENRQLVWRVSPGVWRGIIIASLVLLAISWPVSYWVSANDNQKVYLAQPAAQRLQWINANLKFQSTPIFMYNDADEVAGSWGELYSNWVGSIIGPHLSYLGRLDYLVQVEETPFSSTNSRLASAVFMKQIVDSGVTSEGSLLQHPIVLVQDFYRPFPLPNFTSPYFYQIGDGIFEANNTLIAGLNNVTLPLYSSAVNQIGPWHTVQRQWTESRYALEANVSSSPTNFQSSFLLNVLNNSNYTMNLRYWDASGNNLKVMLDGLSIGTVVYNNTDAPHILTLTGLHVASGEHIVTITIDRSPSQPQYASLDYLSFSRS